MFVLYIYRGLRCKGNSENGAQLSFKTFHSFLSTKVTNMFHGAMCQLESHKAASISIPRFFINV